MIDDGAILYEYLTEAGTELHALVGARVWEDDLPVGFGGDRKALTFHVSNFDSDTAAVVHTALVTFKCYGGSNLYSDAKHIFLTLFDRLQHQGKHTASGEMQSAHLSNRPGRFVDPRTGWVTCMADFVIEFKE